MDTDEEPSTTRSRLTAGEGLHQPVNPTEAPDWLTYVQGYEYVVVMPPEGASQGIAMVRQNEDDADHHFLQCLYLIRGSTSSPALVARHKGSTNKLIFLATFAESTATAHKGGGGTVVSSNPTVVDEFCHWKRDSSIKIKNMERGTQLVFTTSYGNTGAGPVYARFSYHLSQQTEHDTDRIKYNKSDNSPVQDLKCGESYTMYPGSYIYVKALDIEGYNEEYELSVLYPQPSKLSNGFWDSGCCFTV